MRIKRGDSQRIASFRFRPQCQKLVIEAFEAALNAGSSDASNPAIYYWPFSMTLEAAIILGVCILLAAGALAAISRHKKSGAVNAKLIGATGLVETKLDPEGTVLIQGELWRACLDDAGAIATGSKVKVVGTRDHLLLVRVKDR